MENKKKIVMVVLSVLVCIMAVGYAVLAQQLNITGTTSIDSTWKVEITNIGESEVVGKAVSKVTPSYTATTANFSVGLTQPGDSITYDIEISNLGTLKAKVDSINVVMDENDAIKYTTSGVNNGDKLGVGEKTTLTIKVEYDSSVTSQPSITSKDITVTINYVQDLDEGNTSTTYQTYSIGDTVTFAGSNWYVIKNSSGEEDYVTLLKEKVLTNAELGQYAANSTFTCTIDMVEGLNQYQNNPGIYGCTTEGQIVTIPSDTMSYYWSDTCHGGSVYGYTDSDNSGCSGHNDYEGSKVKEYLEGTYINTLGVDNLKEVDGYKIRLITTKEINEDLGAEYATNTSLTFDRFENVPTWIYQNFTENSNNTHSYWTMSKIEDPDTTIGTANWRVWQVEPTGSILLYYVNSSQHVRPVINLLKSSI